MGSRNEGALWHRRGQGSSLRTSGRSQGCPRARGRGQTAGPKDLTSSAAEPHKAGTQTSK